MNNIDTIKKFKALAENYCDLDIFKNTSFLAIVQLEWNCDIEINGKTVEENFRAGNFSFFPGGFKSHHKFPAYSSPLELNSIEAESRLEAKVRIRRIFMTREPTNIIKVVKILFGHDVEGVIKDMIWEQLTYSPITFGEDYPEIDRNFKINLKLDKYEKEITKTYLDSGGLSYIDVFILYLHGDLLHGDDEKLFLYKLLVKNYGSEKINSIIDIYIVIIYKLIQMCLLPASVGFIVNSEKS